MPGHLFKTVPEQKKWMGVYLRLHCRATFKSSYTGIEITDGSRSAPERTLVPSSCSEIPCSYITIYLDYKRKFRFVFYVIKQQN